MVEVAIGPTADGGRVIAVVRDHTVTVMAREDLERKEAHFRIAASYTTDFLQYINVEENRYVWYGEIDRCMGYEPGGFPRAIDAWLELLHPDDKDRVWAEMQRVINEKGAGWDFRYRIRHRDGSYRHWLDRGSVTGWLDNGRPNEGRGGVVDETEAIAAREQLTSALTEVSKLKDRLQAEADYLREEVEGTHGFDEFVGKSQRIAGTLRRAEQVARTDATVLLLGETGSGKEILARGIHARGTRASRPLIKIDCSTLPSGLVESELFGHEKGAFTGATSTKEGRFELADGGTVFLDEIGELPLDLQAKLLRVLEEGVFLPLGSRRERRVDVRVIAATNRNLEDEAREGRFRTDLYYRLNVFPIAIPPLRERREDVPLLVSHLVSRLGPGLGRRVRSVSRPSMDALVAYDWPGNVRELHNVIERALILCTGDVLTVEEALSGMDVSPRPRADSLKGDLESVERTNIVQALEASGWKIKGPGNAADRLGMKPSTLRSRMARLGVQRPAP